MEIKKIICSWYYAFLLYGIVRNEKHGINSEIIAIFYHFKDVKLVL